VREAPPEIKGRGNCKMPCCVTIVLPQQPAAMPRCTCCSLCCSWAAAAEDALQAAKACQHTADDDPHAEDHNPGDHPGDGTYGIDMASRDSVIGQHDSADEQLLVQQREHERQAGMMTMPVGRSTRPRCVLRDLLSVAELTEMVAVTDWVRWKLPTATQRLNLMNLPEALRAHDVERQVL
jgi:hypothetical protein